MHPIPDTPWVNLDFSLDTGHDIWYNHDNFHHFHPYLSIYLPILSPVRSDHYRQAHVGCKKKRGRKGDSRGRGRVKTQGVQGWGISEKERGGEQGVLTGNWRSEGQMTLRSAVHRCARDRKWSRAEWGAEAHLWCCTLDTWRLKVVNPRPLYQVRHLFHASFRGLM